MKKSKDKKDKLVSIKLSLEQYTYLEQYSKSLGINSKSKVLRMLTIEELKQKGYL
jgi:hypothetical protein